MTTRFSRAHLLTQVLSANQREVILYLYDGALNHLDRAFDFITRRDRKQARESIQRAASIIIELSCGLDYNRDGALALRLDSIYTYLIDALSVAARTLDRETLETCQSVLAILEDAWGQAVESDLRSRVPALAASLGLAN